MEVENWLEHLLLCSYLERRTREQKTPQDRLSRDRKTWEMAVDETIGLVGWTLRASILWYKIGELRARSLRMFLARLDVISQRDGVDEVARLCGKR